MKAVVRGARVILALILGGISVGCGGDAAMREQRAAEAGGGASEMDAAAFDGSLAMAEVEALVGLGPRDSGTEGAARAAAHLAARFTELGLEVEVDTFEDETPMGPTVFRNVIARIPGGGRDGGEIVLGSHYDTKRGIGPNFVGANDSGSSTGLLLELARVCRQAAEPSDLQADLVFVAFDGEESMVRYGPRDGFHGSRRYVRRLGDAGRTEAVRAMILADMVGDRDLRVTIPRNSTPWLRTLALEAAAEQGVRHLFGLYPGDIADDHVAFLQAGIPAVNLIDFAYGSAPGRNDYWHTEEDTLDKLSADSLEAVGKVMLHMIRALQADPDLHRQGP